MDEPKKGVARQLKDYKGFPYRYTGSMETGKDKNGWPIYKAAVGTLWDLDGYDTFVPDGYVPVYDHFANKWFYTKQGGPGDPFRQLGMVMDNSIPF